MESLVKENKSLLDQIDIFNKELSKLRSENEELKIKVDNLEKNAPPSITNLLYKVIDNQKDMKKTLFEAKETIEIVDEKMNIYKNIFNKEDF